MSDNKHEPLPVKFSLGNNLLASVASHQPSQTDEELTGEADEPSDNCSRNLLTSKLHNSDENYSKQTVCTYGPHQVGSLLTQAIMSDSEPQQESHSIYTRHPYRTARRGMSTTSTMSTISMPSTADLISDNDVSSAISSGLSSPTSAGLTTTFPVQITSAPGERKDSVAIKGHSEDELSKFTTPDPANVAEALGRKRCITFACNTTPLLSRQNSERPSVKIEEPIQAPVPVKRPSMLKFACPFKDADKPHKKLSSPPPTPAKENKKALSSIHLQVQEPHRRRDSSATVVDDRNHATSRKRSPSGQHIESSASSLNIPRFYEFASSVDESVESWMNAPQFPSRLLKVDGLLEKEKNIRKLSEEVDNEIALEDEMEDEAEDDDNDNFDIEEEDDEDDGYIEDEEDEDFEFWGDSDGNRSDDEEGFAESDEEDDCLFSPQPGTDIPERQFERPTCCRNTSDSSVASARNRKKSFAAFRREKRISIRPSTPELPDSTDFVPGTFDEDRPLEDFYASCMEERKNPSQIVKPQDIDPSFPEEDEEEDEEDAEEEEERAPRRRRASTVRQSSNSRSPSPKTVHSPAPLKRRLISPPPTSRRSSTRNMSPPPPNKRRTSFNRGSPAPLNRASKLRLQLEQRPSIACSTSLPRHAAFFRKKSCLATSPRTKAAPIRKRGALDIVKGLEKKRMRRQQHLYGKREHKPEAGEGVEKMRELGILGKERLGTNPVQPQFIFSV